MIRQAKGIKCVGYLPKFHVLDFLRLTITDSNVFNWLEQEAGHTKELTEYNQFAKEGKSIHMPWLDVDIITGRVVGHEGRHRAASVYMADGRYIPVSICLRDRGYPVYYREVRRADAYGYEKTFLTHADVPKVLVGQFVHREIHIEPDTMTDFWADRNKAVGTQ